jgi:hypothetical protein
VDALEQEALEVLSLVRSMKNTFAPINRIPQEVLSLIPKHCDTDEVLITATHVCRGWREQFISHSSLWTTLDCATVNQTRAYLERSKTSPLDICLGGKGRAPFLNDAFLLTVPHLGRLRSLSVTASSIKLVELIKHFLHCRAPLLEELKICSTSTSPPSIPAVIFDGNLSSLRKLYLDGALTNLPWRNLSNLTTFYFHRVPSNEVSVTQLLDFFEQVPALRDIRSKDAFPDSSDAPHRRIVSLPHLDSLCIIAQPVHSLLLDHLVIPPDGLLMLEFDFSGDKSPIPAYLPRTSKNFEHLSHITSINLSYTNITPGRRCEPGIFLRLEGPNGAVYMSGHWVGAAASLAIVGSQILRSITHLDLSTIGSLMITQYHTSSPPKIEKSPAYQTLLPMNALRILTLADCFNLPFINALNPNQIPSKAVVCPKLEELALFIKARDRLHINKLLEMTKHRWSRGTKLSTLAIVCSQESVPVKEVLKLRDYVSSVVYRLDDIVPPWDNIRDVGDITSYETDCDQC